MIALTALAALGCFQPVNANEFDDAYLAYKPVDYATAFPMLIRLAEKGNAKAEYCLSDAYQRGLGVTQHFAEAFKWYRKAAEQGYVYVQTNLGVRYVKGQGVTQDFSRAFKWFRKAEKQGDATAPINLSGLIHIKKLFRDHQIVCLGRKYHRIVIRECYR